MERNQVALQVQSVTPAAKLFVALELANGKWRVAASDGATKVSEYTVLAGDGARLLEIIERARSRLRLSKEAAVLSCYEAGRDGFWLHRFLESQGGPAGQFTEVACCLRVAGPSARSLRIRLQAP